MNSDVGWSRPTLSGSAETEVSSVLRQAFGLFAAFWPVPANVVMTPAVSTFRTTQFRLSAMYTLPAESTATPCGSFSPAPEATPDPATKRTTPAASILRTRWLRASPM